MLNALKTALGGLWSLPVTLVALPYVVLFTLLGWYRWHGNEGDGFVFVVNTEKSPKWLMKLWKGWAGHAIGQIVVVKSAPGSSPKADQCLVHELEHVNQCMRLGVFQPILYGLILVGVKLGCRTAHPYHDNSFEIAARRAAGQTIDVVK